MSSDDCIYLYNVGSPAKADTFLVVAGNEKQVNKEYPFPEFLRSMAAESTLQTRSPRREAMAVGSLVILYRMGILVLSSKDLKSRA
jgi:hypothetical protein